MSADKSPHEPTEHDHALAYPGVYGRVHSADSMFEPDVRTAGVDAAINHYRSVGLSALGNVEAALAGVFRSYNDIDAALDLPCGYGRVLRWLRLRIPAERLTAGDLDVDGVNFCAEEFGVEPLVSDEDLTKVQFSRTYDLIWVGSLLTHLPIQGCLDVLDVLTSILNPGGMLIFTTHGESCLNQMQVYGPEFVNSEHLFRDGIARFGAHFATYPNQTAYGISIFGREFVRRLAEDRYGSTMQGVYEAERGWDNHQDVWAWQRAATSPSPRPAQSAIRWHPASELRPGSDVGLTSRMSIAP